MSKFGLDDLFDSRSASPPSRPQPGRAASGADEAPEADPDERAAESDSGRSRGRRRAPAGEGWSDLHRRAAFYFSVDQLARLDEASRLRGLSKSEIVRQALDDWFRSNE